MFLPRIAPTIKVRGFTLIELVMVIVIVGVVSVMTTQFVVYGIDIYRGSVLRQQRVAEARFFLERLSREVARAHISSVSVSSGGLCLEFVPVESVGAYRENLIGQNAFNVIQTPEFRDNNSIDYSGKRFSVYTLFPTEFYVADSAVTNNSGSVGIINAYSALGSSAEASVTLNGAQTLTQLSPGQRYFILNTPVRYCLENNQVVRYANYGWVFSTGTGIVMLDDVSINLTTPNQASYFEVASNNLFRVGVVLAHMNLQLSDGGEIRFHQRMSMNYVP